MHRFSARGGTAPKGSATRVSSLRGRLCHRQPSAGRGGTGVDAWRDGTIGLTLNDAKTSIRSGRTESFDFLGYTFGPDRYRKDGHCISGRETVEEELQRVRPASAPSCTRGIRHAGRMWRPTSIGASEAGPRTSAMVRGCWPIVPLTITSPMRCNIFSDGGTRCLREAHADSGRRASLVS
jgi:hypothetical protein